MSAAITKETYLQWYQQMLRMRRFEERAGQAYGQQIRGFCHLYIGQEAVAAGALSATRHDDPFITAYRDHALALGKGISARECMAELYGKHTGCSKGKGGSMHLFSKERFFYGGHGIVGGQIPLGAGIAFADQYKGKDSVTLCFMGDGAVRQGSLNETFNMAMLWKLPVIFICENNGYAMGTSVERTTNVHEIFHIGLGYNMPSNVVDGMKCEDVHQAVDHAVQNARMGNGPSFLEIRTYRYKGHSMSDPAKYRSKEELQKYKDQDPIEHIKEIILSKRYANQKWMDSINNAVKEEIDDAVKFAEESPLPSLDELFKDVYVQENYPFVRD